MVSVRVTDHATESEGHEGFWPERLTPARSARSRLRVGARLAVQAGEVRGLVVRVEPARVRQDPDRAAADLLGLQPHPGPRRSNADAIGAEADDRPPAWARSRGRPESSVGRTRAQLLRDSSSAARVGRGDVFVTPDAVPRQVDVILGREPPRREPGAVRRRREAVARSREVVADLGRAQRRVDPDERRPQARAEDRPERRVACRQPRISRPNRPRTRARPPRRRPRARAGRPRRASARGARRRRRPRPTRSRPAPVPSDGSRDPVVAGDEERQRRVAHRLGHAGQARGQALAGDRRHLGGRAAARHRRNVSIEHDRPREQADPRARRSRRWMAKSTGTPCSPGRSCSTTSRPSRDGSTPR